MAHPSVCLVLLIAISHLHGAMQGRDLRAGLADAQRRWEERRPSSYEFTIEVRCFCYGLEKIAPKFRVIHGDPTNLREMSEESQRLYESFNTIDRLFAAIDRSLSRGQYKSSVKYDEQLGYPVVADLDPERWVKDEELYFRVSDFRVIAVTPGGVSLRSPHHPAENAPRR